MWRVQNERDMMVLLEEFGIESVVVRSQSAPGEVLVVVAPENVVLAAGVVSEMEPPAGVFLRVGPSPGPI